jgi:hypothetical protein
LWSCSRLSLRRELRIQSHGDPLRVFDAFDPTRSADLLIGGNKTGKDKLFYKMMIPMAEAPYDEHLNNPVSVHGASPAEQRNSLLAPCPSGL